MSTVLRSVVLIAALVALAACNRPPESAFLDRGGPESLIDVSSEAVNLSTSSAQDLVDLSNWVAHDLPARAELNCDSTEKHCAEARKILELKNIPASQGIGNNRSVTLVYERIVARDCDPHYRDNANNYYNAHHPAFGCAVAANMVQSVTDKRAFVEPALSDDPYATRAVNDWARAYKPRADVKPYNAIDESLTEKSGSK